MPPLGDGMLGGGDVGPPERVIDVLQPASTSVAAPNSTMGLSRIVL